MKEVKFKSIPKMYEKERSGRKPNTLRRVNPYDVRFIRMRGENIRGEEVEPPKQITIVNTETGEEFTREITDYTEWDGYAIISWRHE